MPVEFERDMADAESRTTGESNEPVTAALVNIGETVKHVNETINVG